VAARLWRLVRDRTGNRDRGERGLSRRSYSGKGWSSPAAQAGRHVSRRTYPAQMQVSAPTPVLQERAGSPDYVSANPQPGYLR